jgi:hypothetical protein
MDFPPDFAAILRIQKQIEPHTRRDPVVMTALGADVEIVPQI